MNKRTVIIRLKGGLGNQLFCYASARAFALQNGYPLKIDFKSGFSRDKFNRSYERQIFKRCSDLLCSNSEMLYPFERLRRAYYKINTRLSLFPSSCFYCCESECELNLLHAKLSKRTHTIYMDGLWQNYSYFHQFSSILYDDLVFNECVFTGNLDLPDARAVAIHYRSYSESPSARAKYMLPIDYYLKAISMIESIKSGSSYYIYSDIEDPSLLDFMHSSFPSASFYFASKLNDINSSTNDFVNLTRFSNIICSHSTFSWWSAYLGACRRGGVIVNPSTLPLPRQKNVYNIG